MSASTAPTTVDLEGITAEVWRTMLGLEVALKPDVVHHEVEERVLTGIVHLVGGDVSVVTVRCTERLACMAAAGMFGVPSAAVNDQDVFDCLGELVGATGSAIAAELPGDWRLSLPSVTTGRDDRLVVVGGEVAERAGFVCEGELLVVARLCQTWMPQ